MKQKTILLMWMLAALFLGSCTQEEFEERDTAMPASGVSGKLIFTSEHAIRGELLVYFREDAVSGVETSVSAMTRGGTAATRSGIVTFDTVLGEIGVKSLQRLFPADPRNEARTRAAGLHRWYLVEFDEGTDLDRAAHALAGIAEVERVEYNQQLQNMASGDVIPLDETEFEPRTRAEGAVFDDPMLYRQWHYINTGDTDIYSKIKAGADVNCDEAWRLCTGDPRVIVAVVDNCVQWDHPDLAANMWVNSAEQNGQSGQDDDSNGYVDDIYGYNFATNTPLTLSSPSSESADHGTHVAGTVAAVNNNATGVCGIAGGTGHNDGVKIMSCQIFYNGSGGSSSITSRAIKYAADNGASIIQCSFGFAAGTYTSDSKYAASASTEKQAIDYFIGTQNCDAVSGGLAIFAAGNEFTAMSSYPGAYRDYISVTAMSCDFTPAYYTNYDYGCNIAAPGGDLCQSLLEKNKEYTGVLSTINSGRYGYSQGTSMACPHVSGVAALGLSYALQLGKTFTPSQFNALLLTSVNSIDAYCTGSKRYINDQGGYSTLDLTSFSKKMGTGYIDAFQVLMNVRGTTCIPVPVGTQYVLDLQPYMGNANVEISTVEIPAEDKARLGMSADPTVFTNKIVLKCSNPGSAIIKVTMLAGTSSGAGISSMPITREFALIAREIHSENGGWL